MSTERVREQLEALFGPPAPTALPGGTKANIWRSTGIEYVLPEQPVALQRMRGLWRERQANRGIPLLLLSPNEANNRLNISGLTEDTSAPRSIDLSAFLTELSGLSGLSDRQSAQRLSEIINHLSQQTIPGVTVHGLLTNYFVEQRLRPYRQELSEYAASVRDPHSWRNLFTSLGYTIDQDSRGYILRNDAGRPLAVVHPLADPAMFGQVDDSGALPEGRLLRHRNEAGAEWGILAASGRYRLFDMSTERGARTDQWLEIDAQQLPDDRKNLLGLLSPQALHPEGFLRQQKQDSLLFGAKLKERIEEQIREFTLPSVARGLGKWVVEHNDGDLSDPDTRQEIEHATILFLFRSLFLLYAESAGYLAVSSPAYQPHSISRLSHESRELGDNADSNATSLWDRLKTLTHAIRTGNRAWSVPAYNGTLFASDELPGASLLERASVTDNHVVVALTALGYDVDVTDSEAGIDYAGLEIGHIGAIYESLLGLNLSLATETLGWDKKNSRFVPMDEPGERGVAADELFFQSQAGSRKAGGVFYTRQEFVRHLVAQAVVPTLDEHLERVRQTASRDAVTASHELFQFRVIDPAMGSGHFLVDALDVIADRIQDFLAEVPIPPVRESLAQLRSEAGLDAAHVEDGQLLRRLVLKRCIYGVDLSKMAVELARVALWLRSFVPGLALTYLGHNLQQGDSLVGVARLDAVRSTNPLLLQESSPVVQKLQSISKDAATLATIQDRTPAEVKESINRQSQLEEQLAGLRRIFDCWTAEPFGVIGGREQIATLGDRILDGDMPDKTAKIVAQAGSVAEQLSFLYWPIAFPEVFDPANDRPGFDAVIGNPPWDEVTVEELGFYALHDPGLRGLPNGRARRERIELLLQRFPQLESEFRHQQREKEKLRRFFERDNGYALQGGGDTDLYQLFCERYTALARSGGRIGVVLPRTTFLVKGARGFRRWLFSAATVERIDFLLNRARWAFDMEPRYTIALLAASHEVSKPEASFCITGPSICLNEFERVQQNGEVKFTVRQLARWTTPHTGEPEEVPTWEVPLLPSTDAARIFDRISDGPRFDEWARDNGRVFATAELHESKRKHLFRHETGTPVWKGESFDRYDPHGRHIAGYADWSEAFEQIQDTRQKSITFRRAFDRSTLQDPLTHPIWEARLAFRDVSRARDSVTVRACLIPPKVFLTNKAPYLVFPEPSPHKQAYLLGVLNSLPFDWQARRFVETNLNFFVLDLLRFPPEHPTVRHEIALRAASLSCVDQRFTHFAGKNGVPVQRLRDDERQQLRAEIDALVAQSYSLSVSDLEIMFADFTFDAVPRDYRRLVLEEFEKMEAIHA